MHNIFLLYMPPGNAQAMVHYEDTIKGRVDIQRLTRFVSQDLRARLIAVFGANRMMWGSDYGNTKGAFPDMVSHAVAATSLLTPRERHLVLHDTGKQIFARRSRH